MSAANPGSNASSETPPRDSPGPTPGSSRATKLRSEAAREPLDGTFASDQGKDGVDRRRARAAGNQHAQRHHHLRGFQLVAGDRVLDRSRDALAFPRQRREFALQFRERAAITIVEMLRPERIR